MQTLKVFSETVQTLHHLVPTQNIKECIIFAAPEEPHTALSIHSRATRQQQAGRHCCKSVGTKGFNSLRVTYATYLYTSTHHALMNN